MNIWGWLTGRKKPSEDHHPQFSPIVLEQLEPRLMLSAGHRIFGLDFGPYIDGQAPPDPISRQQIVERMSIIAPYTEWVRSYGATNGLDEIPSVARSMGLRVAMGVHIDADEATNQAEIDNLLAAAEAGLVDIAIVGNEVIHTAEEYGQPGLVTILKDRMTEVREGLDALGLTALPVTTSDTYGDLVRGLNESVPNYDDLTYKEVLDLCGVVFVNHHPYHEGEGIATAVGRVSAQYDMMQLLVGAKPVYVAETGWPDAGSVVGGAVPSPENAARYFYEFDSWADENSVPYFYFEAFDENWKGGPGSAERYWGLWAADGTLKPAMQYVLYADVATARLWDGEPRDSAVADSYLPNTFGGKPDRGTNATVDVTTSTVRSGERAYEIHTNSPIGPGGFDYITLPLTGFYGSAVDQRDVSRFEGVEFWVKNETGASWTLKFEIKDYLDSDDYRASLPMVLGAGTDWTYIYVPLDLNPGDGWIITPQAPDLSRARQFALIIEANQGQAVDGSIFVDDMALVESGWPVDPATEPVGSLIGRITRRQFDGMWGSRDRDNGMLPSISAYANVMALNNTAAMVKLLPGAVDRGWVTRAQADAYVAQIVQSLDTMMDNATYLPPRNADRQTLAPNENMEESSVDAAFMFLSLYQYKALAETPTGLKADIATLLDRFDFAAFSSPQGWKLAYLINTAQFTAGTYDGYSGEIWLISLAAHLAGDVPITTHWNSGVNRVRTDPGDPASAVVHTSTDWRAPFVQWLLPLFVDVENRGVDTFPDASLATNPYENAVRYQQEVHAKLDMLERTRLLQPDAGDDGTGGTYEQFSVYKDPGQPDLFMPWSVPLSLLGEPGVGEAAFRHHLASGLHGPLGMTDSATWTTGESQPSSFTSRHDLWNTALSTIAFTQYLYDENDFLASLPEVAAGLDLVFASYFGTDGRHIVSDASGERTAFHGVNLPGLEYGGFFNNAYPGVEGTDFFRPRAEDLDAVKAMGFDHVRLPLEWARLVTGWQAGEALPTVLDTDYLAAIDDVVRMAGDRGLYVVLDIHDFLKYWSGVSAYVGVNDSVPHQQLLARTWRLLGEHYADNPVVLGYDLMNEPLREEAGSTNWHAIAQTIVTAIREVDALHLIFVEGPNYSLASNWAVENAGGPFVTDTVTPSRIVYSPHVYFDWDNDSDYEAGEEAGPIGRWQYYVRDRLMPVIQWSIDNDVPLYLGELGLPSTDQWAEVLVYGLGELLEPNRVSWATWFYIDPARSQDVMNLAGSPDGPVVDTLDDYPGGIYQQMGQFDPTLFSPLYGDTRDNPWQMGAGYWGNVSVDFTSTGQVHAGGAAISVAYQDNYDGVKLIHQFGLDTRDYTDLWFWLYPTTADLNFKFFTTAPLPEADPGSDPEFPAGYDQQPVLTDYISPLPGQWQAVKVPLRDIDIVDPADPIVNGIAFRNMGSAQGIFYLDEIMLAGDSSEAAELVTRFYVECLGRAPDAQGLNNWVADLVAGTRTGADVAAGFMFSQEYLNRNRIDSEFVDDSYHAFFDREPDAPGKANWLADLAYGTLREDVLNGFIYSAEFTNLADEYDILAFSQEDQDDYLKAKLVRQFVTRFYVECLDRSPDPVGLANWVDDLLAGRKTGADVAFGFMFSQEYFNRNRTDSEFVDDCYRAFFGREPDAGGKANWLAALAGGASRLDVLNGFLYSLEFSNLCGVYGILPNLV